MQEATPRNGRDGSKAAAGQADRIENPDRSSPNFSRVEEMQDRIEPAQPRTQERYHQLNATWQPDGCRYRSDWYIIVSNRNPQQATEEIGGSSKGNCVIKLE